MEKIIVRENVESRILEYFTFLDSESNKLHKKYAQIPFYGQNAAQLTFFDSIKWSTVKFSLTHKHDHVI